MLGGVHYTQKCPLVPWREKKLHDKRYGVNVIMSPVQFLHQESFPGPIAEQAAKEPRRGLSGGQQAGPSSERLYSRAAS